MLSEKVKEYLWFVVLLSITLITTTLAGMMWTLGKPLFMNMQGELIFPPQFTQEELIAGLSYSLPFLGILTVHEFGHYITARFYKIAVTLPKYIPLWFLDLPTIGTLGAYIRIKGPIVTRRQFFDVGIAGPLSGFFAALIVLFWGYTHLPDPEHIFTIHPEYKEYGLNYADFVYQDREDVFAVGDNLLMLFFKHVVASNPDHVPNSYEIIHYPFLFAGFLSLFFTALNLIPLGQLDGGHVLYGFIGSERFNMIAPAMFTAFIFFAGIGVVNPHQPMEDILNSSLLYFGFLLLAFSKVAKGWKNILTVALAIYTVHYGIGFLWPDLNGSMSYLVFALVVGRFLGIHHPPALIEVPLDPKRKALGVFALVVFILCFTPYPFS